MISFVTLVMRNVCELRIFIFLFVFCVQLWAYLWSSERFVFWDFIHGERNTYTFVFLLFCRCRSIHSRLTLMRVLYVYAIFKYVFLVAANLSIPILLTSRHKSYNSLSERLHVDRLILFLEHRLNMSGEFS